MANQEFVNGLVIMIVNVILICIAALVAVGMISFFIECVSRIWSSLFSGPPEAPNYNVPTLRAETHVNRPNYYLGTNITRETKRVVAIDTECVGAGFKGSQSMLARVSLVNRNGQVYDTFVKPTMPVTDYRTFVSGIRRGDLEDAADYLFVRMQVARLLWNCILVGHDVKNDLDSLDLKHPAEDIRDTSTFGLFRDIYSMNQTQDVFKNAMTRKSISMGYYDPMEVTMYAMQACSEATKRFPKNQKLSLKWLAKHLLKREIQVGEHSSIEDARAALDLYLLFEKEWETKLAQCGQCE